MSTPKDQDPVVETAKERRDDENGTRILQSGVEARLHPVSAALISEVTNKIKYPPVPTYMNPEKGREEQNPADPHYLAERQEVENKRAMAAMDAMAMFGIELVDGLPENGKWLQQLKFLERQGLIDLSNYDLENEVDLEFLFKKHIAMSGADYAILGELSGLNEEAIAAAAESFRRNKR